VKPEDEYSPEEAAKRRDAVLKNALAQEQRSSRAA
jgi:hypothetical protein